MFLSNSSKVSHIKWEESKIKGPSGIFSLSKSELKEVSKSHKSKSYPLSSLLSTFYNASSYCFVSPFRFRKDLLTGRYVEEKRSRIIQLGLIIGQFLAIFTYLEYTYVGPRGLGRPLDRETSFLYHYKNIMNIMWLLTIFNLCMKGWTNQKNMLKMLNKFDDIDENFERLGVEMLSPALVQGFSIFFPLATFTWVAYDKISFYVNEQSITDELLLEACTFKTEYCIAYFATHSKDPTSTVIPAGNASDLPWPDLILGVLMLFGNWAATLLTHFADITVVVHAASFYIVVRQYAGYLNATEPPHTEDDDNIERESMILDVFEEICKLTELIEKTTGSIITGICFPMLPYYSWQAYSVAVPGPNSQVAISGTVKLFIYVVAIGSFLFLAAEANSMLGSLRTWLQNSEARMTRKFKSLEMRLDFVERVVVSLNQLESNRIGIRGGCFTVTYGFVGSMASLILTYSVLIFQLSSANK